MNDMKLNAADFAKASESLATDRPLPAAAPQDAERFAAVMERHSGEGFSQPHDSGRALHDGFSQQSNGVRLLHEGFSQHEDGSRLLNDQLPQNTARDTLARDGFSQVRNQDSVSNKDLVQMSDREQPMADKTLEAARLTDACAAVTAGSGRAASAADAKRFGAAFERSTGHHDLDTGGLKKRGGSIASDAEAAKSVQSLFHDFAMPEFKTTNAAPAQAAAAAASPDAEALEGLVDRILVSAPEKGAPEVRLVLNSDVLKDTTISITRDLTGQLSVKITSGDAASLQTLVAGRSDLSQLLQVRESQPVRVELKTEAEADADDENESDARRRSRGLDDGRGEA